jgi:hypothetical protein
MLVPLTPALSLRERGENSPWKQRREKVAPS